MELITAKCVNNTLTLFANGRLDTINASLADELITKYCEEYNTENVVLDAENLEYISSTGLRSILKLRKNKPNLKIINVTSEIYDIFEMTGFSEMIPIEKAYRKMSVDGCEIIGKGAKGTVYRYNSDTVIKVFNDSNILPAIHRERELARKAFVLDVPTAISYDVVKVGDQYGSVFELLDTQSYSNLIKEHPENLEKYVKDYTDLVKLIHNTQVKEDDMPDGKIIVYSWFESADKLLPADVCAKIHKLIDEIPDTLNMLHCDYHTNNIMCQNGETILIDMDTLSHGHPIIELANIFVTYVGFVEMDPKNVENFLGFSSDTALKFWDLFMPLYFETEDKVKLKEYEDKISLLGYCRVVSHIIKRKPIEECKEQVDNFIAKITTLANSIDTLNF